MKWLKGEMSNGKVYYLAAGTCIGNGAVIAHWTHVVYYDPVVFFVGIAMVVVGWKWK